MKQNDTDAGNGSRSHYLLLESSSSLKHLHERFRFLSFHSLRSHGQVNPDCGPHSRPPARARRDALYTQARVFQLLHLTLREWPRPPCTARVERGPSEAVRSASIEPPSVPSLHPTATPTRHTPSQSSTAPLHQHREGPAQAACRRRPTNQRSLRACRRLLPQSSHLARRQ